MDREQKNTEKVLRALATASRSLRLYPPASPIPRQSVDAVANALGDCFSDGAESVPLTVGREGFESFGELIGAGVPGSDDLATELRTHGVSEMHFSRDVTSEDVLKTLMLISRPADDVRSEGGLGALMTMENVQGVSVLEVVLTLVDGPASDDAGADDVYGDFDDEADESQYLELARDPARFNAWLGKALYRDRAELQNDLNSLVEIIGPLRFAEMATTLSAAFSSQTTETRDCLLGLAMKPGPFRDLMGEMFCHQTAGEIASCMLAGSFGRNMLALSTALASLPLDRIDEDVLEQVHAMLPGHGHSDVEGRFLDHMIEVRKRSAPEPSLAASDQAYLATAHASAIQPDDMEKARHDVEESGAVIDDAGVRTMLALLDQQTDAEHVQECAANLASLVGHLLGGQKVLLADYVVAELSSRSDRVDVRKLLSAVVSPEALGGMLDAVLADPSLELHATSVMRVLDESACDPLVAQAVTRKADGIKLAERLLGKRVIESLNVAAPHADWYHLRPLVARLAAEGDPRSVATVQELARQHDAEARREIVAGLALAGGSGAQKLLGELIFDTNSDVAIAAARALAKSGLPGSGESIVARIEQLDLDNADFELGREFIEALVLTPGKAADELLAKLAARHSLIKRGRFSEVQEIVAAAQRIRAQETVGQ